ncbi:MAG: sulfur carrier protein ThiS [Neisseriaceae bacterium]|nr:sulfur carrier protein ThiS [Neisseriaceae bacterium]
MNILINGKVQDIANALTLADLVDQIQPEPPFAVAVNTVFIPKSAYKNTQLKDGDQVEIVRPVAGG